MLLSAEPIFLSNYFILYQVLLKLNRLIVANFENDETEQEWSDMV